MNCLASFWRGTQLWRHLLLSKVTDVWYTSSNCDVQAVFLVLRETMCLFTLLFLVWLSSIILRRRIIQHFTWHTIFIISLAWARNCVQSGGFSSYFCQHAQLYLNRFRNPIIIGSIENPTCVVLREDGDWRRRFGVEWGGNPPTPIQQQPTQDYTTDVHCCRVAE